MSQVSEAFEIAFASGSGGCVRDCECGITYFDGSQGWTWEDGELEELRAKAVEKPGQYKELDGTVSTMFIDGKEYVIGCERCKSPHNIETFVVNHAPQIIAFLTKHTKALADAAERERNEQMRQHMEIRAVVLA